MIICSFMMPNLYARNETFSLTIHLNTSRWCCIFILSHIRSTKMVGMCIQSFKNNQQNKINRNIRVISHKKFDIHNCHPKYYTIYHLLITFSLCSPICIIAFYEKCNSFKRSIYFFFLKTTCTLPAFNDNCIFMLDMLHLSHKRKWILDDVAIFDNAVTTSSFCGIGPLPLIPHYANGFSLDSKDSIVKWKTSKNHLLRT